MRIRNILPFEKPLISYEPTVSHLTGMIASNLKKYECVFYNNFIDIVMENAVDFYDVKNWLRYWIFEFCKIPRKIVFHLCEEDIVKLLCGWIDENYYILVSFETYYVSNYPTYNNRKFRHYAMIIGYDREKNVFLCGDFFDFSLYTVSECPMKEVVQAIVNNGERSAKGFAKDFTLLRMDETVEPKLDINLIIMSLEMLLTENNSNNKRQYGLAVFDRIIDMIEKGNVDDHKTEFKRYAQFVYEHIRVMRMRTQYIQNVTNDNALQEVILSLGKSEKIVEQYRNYILKLLLTKQDSFPVLKRRKYIDSLCSVKQIYRSDIIKLKDYLTEVKI